MKFLGYTMGDPATTPGGPPTQEQMDRMNGFIQDMFEKGVLLATGGLAPLDEGVRVSYHDGEFTVLDGPFTEAKELVGGWALMECRDRDEAVEWTKRFLAIAGEGESTLREVAGGPPE